MKQTHHHSRHTRAGFSLVEILVVLSIAAILGAVTLGGYSSMRASNRRTSCQANMAQIYHAIRLYATDYDGNVPYYNPGSDCLPGTGTGIGLWALYGFANASDSDKMADANMKPEKRYVSNPKVFHCPSDTDNDQLFTDAANTLYNQNFISYQIQDPVSNACTFEPSRTTDVTALGPDTKPVWQRQLLHIDGSVIIDRPPTDDTVVLWCPFHRKGNGTGEDNVLFWDGSVQSIPVSQDLGGTTYTDWQRLPEHAGN